MPLDIVCIPEVTKVKSADRDRFLSIHILKYGAVA